MCFEKTLYGVGRMRDALKRLVLSTVLPVQRLKQHRDDLRAKLALLEAENAELRGRTIPTVSYDYDADGMKLWDKNLAALTDPRFVGAYVDSVKNANIEFRAY